LEHHLSTTAGAGDHDEVILPGLPETDKGLASTFAIRIEISEPAIVGGSS
jgi:hypothetical protein